jgi:hypothetical protein
MHSSFSRGSELFPTRMEVFDSFSMLAGPVNNATDLITPDSESCMLIQGFSSGLVTNEAPLPKIVLSTAVAIDPYYKVDYVPDLPLV